MLLPEPLVGLDPRRPSYPREAAERITSTPCTALQVQAAIDAVPRMHRAMVETLVVTLFAERIVRAHRVNAISIWARVPTPLEERVKTHAIRLARLIAKGRA